MILGTVTAIDRTNRVVRATLVDGPEIEAEYFGTPPPPLSIAGFVATGPRWHCEGAFGSSRSVLHDDFNYVNLVSVTEVDGDTPWVLRGSGGTFTQGAATAGDAQGAIALTTNAALNVFVALSKDNGAVLPPALPGALWWSGRVWMNAITTCFFSFGLGSAPWWTVGASPNIAALRVDSALGVPGNWYLVTGSVSAGTANNHDLGIAAAAATWYDLDIVYAPDLWIAAWIDGTGPYVIETTDIPTSSEALQPGMLAFTRAAANRQLIVDWQHLELVEVVHPQLFAA